MHHVFDQWMQQEIKHVPFERYADDAMFIQQVRLAIPGAACGNLY